MISKNATKRTLKKSKIIGSRISRKMYSRQKIARRFAFDRLRGQLDRVRGLNVPKNQWQEMTAQRRKALAQKKIGFKMLQSVSRQKKLPRDVHRNIAQFL